MKNLDRKHRLNLILTFAIGIIFIFLGLAITFFTLHTALTPEEMVVGLLPPGPPMPVMIEQLIQQYGLSGPLFFRFLRYLGDFMSSSWGWSQTFSVGGTDVGILLMRSLPHTIELLIFPLIVGIFLGYVIGRVSNRTERNWLKKTIQLLSAVGTAIPIFFFGMFFQYTLAYLFPVFPAIGYKSVIFDPPDLITGFMILDAFLSGDPNLALDIFLHYILPTIILLISITALMTRAYSSNRVKDSYKKKTILSHTAKTSVVFGAIFMYLFLIDVTFNLYGFGSIFMAALQYQDYFLIRGFLYVFIILFALTIIISNLIFSIYWLKKDKNILPLKDVENTTEREPNLSAKSDLKNYLKNIVRSPLTYIGLVVVLIFLFAAMFPELISGQTLEQARGIYIGSWAPPSPNHPFGTTNFGRDVLALVVYGTRNYVLFGAGAVVIGLIGGLIFGLLASKFNRKVHTIIMSISLIFYILPGILLVLLSTMAFGNLFEVIIFTIGLLLIPSFTRIIANTEFRIVPIGKKIISYMPLFAAFAILLYASLGFLGYDNYQIISLGGLVSDARLHLYDAPWASFFPSATIFFMVIGLFILHEGLAKQSR